VNRSSYQDIKLKRTQLQTAESELKELKQLVHTFEAQVDDRLGSLLDLLSELRAETNTLDEKLREIRERRLFGEDLMRYLDGAPKPTRPSNLDDVPVVRRSKRNSIHIAEENSTAIQEGQTVDIRVLYRKLARQNHPDLARSDADRAMCNEQMAEINRAYSAGDLATLLRLAGMSIPYGMDKTDPPLHKGEFHAGPMTEQEGIEFKLKAVRQEIARLSRLPIVKLSLDVKLARLNRRDLLSEIALDLEYKIDRKIAERDYLRSQIFASMGRDDHNPTMG